MFHDVLIILGHSYIFDQWYTFWHTFSSFCEIIISLHDGVVVKGMRGPASTQNMLFNQHKTCSIPPLSSEIKMSQIGKNHDISVFLVF